MIAHFRSRTTDVILALAVGATLTVLGTRTADRARADDKNPPGPNAVAPLTDEGLTRMLNDMGYDEVKPVNTKTGSYNEVTVKEAGWTFRVLAELSADKTNLWLTLGLGTLPTEDKLPPQRLLGMLEANATYSGAYFTYYKNTRAIGVSQRTANRGVTAKVLRNEIENLITMVRNTDKLWSKWEDAPSVPAQPPKASAGSPGAGEAAGVSMAGPVRPRR